MLIYYFNKKPGYLELAINEVNVIYWEIIINNTRFSSIILPYYFIVTKLLQGQYDKNGLKSSYIFPHVQHCDLSLGTRGAQ